MCILKGLVKFYKEGIIEYGHRELMRKYHPVKCKFNGNRNVMSYP